MNCSVDNFTRYWHFNSGHKAEEPKVVNMYLNRYFQNSETWEKWKCPVQNLRWSLAS